jgi:antitoxin VapB
MLQISQDTEHLARKVAARLGRQPEDVIRAAIEHEARTGSILPWRRPGREPSAATKEEFFARLDEIALRSAARPTVDPRSDDEIIGYDDFGLPR